MQDLDEGEVVGDVAAVAVAEEDNPPARLGRHVPGRKLHPVGGFERDLLVGHPLVPGVAMICRQVK
jgi:hypothetical protein